MAWEKGPEVLIEAVARLGERMKGVEVVFAGADSRMPDGRSYFGFLRARADELGVRCRFEGHVSHDDLPEYFGAARVVAIPSRYESFSMVGVEAMAAGRPVVCNSRVGLTEYLTESNVVSIVPPDDPAALAEALRPYLENREVAARAGEGARRLFEVRLSPEMCARELEAVFEQAIRHRRTGR